MVVHIYGLFDPRDPKKIRYVGKTNHDLGFRLQGHIYEAEDGINTYKNNWIRKLLRQDIQPEIILIESVKEQIWPEKERFWIKFYKKDLTNISEGGIGGGPMSQETKDKLRVANTGKEISKETRAKMSASGLGRIVSKETKERLSFAMKGKKRNPLSQETKDKIRASKIGKKMGPMPRERKEKIRKANTGQKRSTEQKARMSVAKKGQKYGPRSLETKSKIGLGVRRYWVLKRRAVLKAA